MQVRTNRAGEVVGTGSLNHAELARLQAAAKRKPKGTSKKDEDEPELLDESEDQTESAPPGSKAKPTT